MDKAKVVRHQQNLTDRLNCLFVHDVHTAIIKSLSHFRTEWVVYDVSPRSKHYAYWHAGDRSDL